jgi:hypothetical protein
MLITIHICNFYLSIKKRKEEAEREREREENLKKVTVTNVMELSIAGLKKIVNQDCLRG